MRKKRFSKKDKIVVEKRAFSCCEYCQSHADYATQDFVMEHIIPLSKGGTDDLKNIAFACLGCNWHKYDKTEANDPATGILVPLFNPRKQAWKEHFIWSEDFLKIVGISAFGRATVDALKLNRPKLVNRRSLFLKVAMHPPKHTI